MEGDVAPHDLVEWAYTLLPFFAAVVAALYALRFWGAQRERRRADQADPEALLRARRHEGAISEAEYERRIASFRRRAR